MIRKLKIYREAGLEDSSGSLSLNQQRYYRAQLELPIKMKYAGELFDAVLLNISAGGAGAKTEKPLKSGAPVALVFPDSRQQPAEAPAELPGRVTWTNKGGQYGIQFGDLPASLRTSLQRWLRAEMKKDGWDVAPPRVILVAPHSAAYELPISTPATKTSVPPSTTCNVAETQGDSM